MYSRSSIQDVEINNIVLSSNDDERLQNFDRIKWFQFGDYPGKVCKTELLKYKMLLILMII